jgi:hypothetical protein
MKKLSKPKSILIALITPIILQACSTTPRDYSEQNTELLSNLTPMASYFKERLFNQCDEEVITLENYTDIIERRESKSYQSPHNPNECIPISFNVHEPENFYTDILENATDKERATALIKDLQMEGVDRKQVLQFDLKDGRLARFVKYTPEIEADVQNMAAWRYRDMLIDHWDEFFFLHELFHTTDINHDSSVPQKNKETLSDIATVISISTAKDFTIDKSIELMKEVYHARYAETKTPHGYGYSSHYQEDMIFKFMNHLNKMADNNELLRADSLADAAHMARDLVLNTDQMERSSFNASFYWTEGEEEKMQKRAFAKNDNAKEVFISRHQEHAKEVKDRIGPIVNF